MDQVLELAIAASARPWPDRLHRHVLDHGGARVAGRVLDATQAQEARFDVLLIDDVCSFLSPRLVALLRQDGRQVIGVFDRDDGPDAKRRLLECGIADVIESDATADEFLTQAATLAATALPVRQRLTRASRATTIGVLGLTAGVGATEVAVGLAWQLSPRVDTILVDLDARWPSVAQRLDLAPHPNLLTLVDAVVHGHPYDEAETSLGKLRVVPGAAQPGWQGIPRHEVDMAVDTLSSRCRVLVADLGSADQGPDGGVEGVDTLVLVISGDPVGVTRLVRDAPRWSERAESGSMVVVANRVPQRRFHRSEVAAELEFAFGSVPVLTIPHDDGVITGAWEGSPSDRGKFGRAMAKMAGLIAGAVSP